MKVWATAAWLLKKGRDRLRDKLSESERRELRRIVLASKGRPGNVSKRDRARLKSLVKKATTGT